MIIHLKQDQKLQLTQRQLQSLHILQMTGLELSTYLQELSLENPLIEPEQDFFDSESPSKNESFPFNASYSAGEYRITNPEPDGETDIFSVLADTSGLEETLENHLRWQIIMLHLPDRETYLLKCLVQCLDEQGYLRMTAEEIAASFLVTTAEAQTALVRLRAMDPPGVGAADLSSCLVRQLEHMHAPQTAVQIAKNHLRALAQGYYRDISAKLNVPLSAVEEANKLIRSLNPRPSNGFSVKDKPVIIRPDVFVDCIDGKYVLREWDDKRRWFSVNRYYSDLLEKTDDSEVKQYLRQKMRQVPPFLCTRSCLPAPGKAHGRRRVLI